MPVPNATQAQLNQMRRRNAAAGSGINQAFLQLLNPDYRSRLQGTAAPAAPVAEPAAATGDWRRNPDGTARFSDTPVEDLVAGQNAVIRSYNKPAPGLLPPAPQVTPADRARQEAVTTMAQQYAPQDFWKRENAQAMIVLASKEQAPTGTKLSDYYAAQSAAGSGNMSEIVAGLSRGLEPGRASAMKTWAEANPALAFREYSRRQAKGMLGEATPEVDRLAIEPEQRAVAQAGYGAATVDPAVMAGVSALSGASFSGDERFKNPAFTAEQAPEPQRTEPVFAPGSDNRQIAEGGYGRAVEPGAFAGASPLSKTAFVGGGLQREQAMTADMAQAVPAVSEPFLEPGEIRASNLTGNEALMQARAPQAAAADQLLLQHLQRSRGAQAGTLIAQGVK